MRLLLLLILSCLVHKSNAQTGSEQMVGDWKWYLKDKTSFEFLRLRSDGTGLKCFGQTINGKDTLFEDHFTTLQITKWKITTAELILESKNTVSFPLNPVYKLVFTGKDKISLAGEHLIFYLYPSFLNRKEFQRTVQFERADKISKSYGVKAATCISDERNLFVFKPGDKLFHTAEYKGFDDLIPKIIPCNHGFEYVQHYKDPSYQINVPVFIKRWSFGFGNKTFYISFDSEKDDKTETSIVIYYDFDNEMKDYYFSQIKNGKEKKNIVQQNGFEIYKTINWQGKFEGKVFLNNSMVVAYYTRDKNLEQQLQTYIVSLKYR